MDPELLKITNDIDVDFLLKILFNEDLHVDTALRMIRSERYEAREKAEQDTYYNSKHDVEKEKRIMKIKNKLAEKEKELTEERDYYVALRKKIESQCIILSKYGSSNKVPNICLCDGINNI